MSAGVTEFEALLREALAPVDPPDDLLARMELRLVNLTELAQDEFEAWELSAMRDPRNWARPAAAAVLGASARAGRRAHDPGFRRGGSARASGPLNPALRARQSGPPRRADTVLSAHARLLPPSVARDGRGMLLLRAPDLS